jgi:hypothetical protein
LTCLLELKSVDDKIFLTTIPDNMKTIELEPQRHFQVVLQKKPKALQHLKLGYKVGDEK